MTPDTNEGDHDVRKDGLEATLADAREIGATRKQEGWYPIIVPAGDTTPVPDIDDINDPWGFVHTVPSNFADEVTGAVEEGTFPKYDVYRNRVDNDVYFATELLDPETQICLLVVGMYSISDADTLYQQAVRKGNIRTHLQTLDGTVIASFEHEAVEKFFPDVMDALAGRN